jgi:predicted outer membrane repeat protein
VSDIGSAIFTRCQFIGNEAFDKGGAIATQVNLRFSFVLDPYKKIETPETNSVKLRDALFCFNQAPTVRFVSNLFRPKVY